MPSARKLNPAKLTRHQRDELWSLMTVAEREAYLRANATPSELVMRDLLDLDERTRGAYRFQAHCCGYFADFLFPAAKLIVELDGSVHHGATARIADARRTRELGRAGYTVIRFWNGQLREPAWVQHKILQALGIKTQPVVVSAVAADKISLDDIMVSTRRRKPRLT